MGRIRGKDTAPERLLRSRLFAQGARFRKHSKGVPGRPDIVHKATKVAVFVDGCFWHGCPKHYRPPKTQKEFWAWKHEYNKGLRARKRKALEDAGWAVIEFWECDVRQDPDRLATEIRALVEHRRSGSKRTEKALS